MYHFFTRVLFVLGFIIGVLLAVIFLKYTNNAKLLNNNDNLKSYNRWFDEKNLIRKRTSLDQLRYGNSSHLLLESQYLFEQIKVLCLILVRNMNNAQAASDTWTKSCNKVSLIDVHEEKKKIPVKKNKEDSSWVKLCKALKDVPDIYKWVLISNDYNFVIVENLRLLVAGLDYDKKYYLGHAVMFWNTVYNMGQAGYVISRGTLLALKDRLLNDSCISSLTYWNQEDFYLGKYLNSLNITPSDTRDSFGLSTFHPFNWQQVFFPKQNYYKKAVYPVKCCSKRSITFHATEADKIYMFYYMLYKLQVFHDGKLGNKPAPTPMPEREVWQGFLRERGIEKDDISPQEYYKQWENLIHDPNTFAKELKKRFDDNK